jgi:type IV secretion system protein VirB2
MTLVNKFSTMWKVCLMMFFAISLLFVAPSHEARAADTVDKNKISDILCNVVKLITGNIGKAISVLIIITLAIALFLGKVSWGMAIAVAVGMGIMFGAPGIVSLVADGKSSEICPA